MSSGGHSTSGGRLAIEPAGAPERRVALPSKGVLIVGSEPGSAGLVVPAEGVAKTHVAIAPLKGGGHGVKLIAEAAGAELNGQAFRTAKLSLGDELRLGSARLLVVHTETGTQSDGLASGRSGRDAGEPLRADALPGFRLIEALGRGAVGRVVLAHQENLDRRVAIKLLDKAHAKDAEFVARFRDEARAAAALHHANVVTVFDVGETDGQPYLVMEYMSRGSLEDRLSAEGPLPWRAVLGVLRDAASALEFAGSKGIVHRDVKPANLMQTNTGETKIADLGLATTNFGGDAAGAGKIQGTPHFMAPEQARGETVDERADLYALGASAWRLLTGETPFRGENARAILRAAQSEAPRSPSELAIGVPAGVDALILELMAKDPEHRPRSAALLRARVEQLIAHNGHAPEASGSGAGLLLKLGAAGLLVAGGVGAWLLLRDDTAEPVGPFAEEALGTIGIELAGDPPLESGESVDGAPTGGGSVPTSLTEEQDAAAYERQGWEKLEAALLILDDEARLESLLDVKARYAGVDPGRRAAEEIEALRLALASNAGAATAEPRETGAGDTTASADADPLEPFLEDVRALAFAEDELLPPRVGLAAVALATLPDTALAILAGQPEALEAFETRRDELLAPLAAQVEGEAEARLDAARTAATEGDFDAAATGLAELRAWLTERPEVDGAASEEADPAQAPSSTRTSPLGEGAPRLGGAAGRIPDEPGDAPAPGPAPTLEPSPFDDAFLLGLERRVLRFEEALPDLRILRAAFLRQADRARIGAALGPAALADDLADGSHADAAGQLAALRPDLQHPPFQAAAEALERQLSEAGRFAELVRGSWDEGAWKRQRLQLPRPDTGFSEVVSLDARGVSVEGEDGAPRRLPWNAFAGDPDAVLNLIQERLEREWSAAELRSLGGYLFAATLDAVHTEARRGLDRGGLLASKASALEEAFEPLATFLEAHDSPELRALFERERQAAARIASALTSAQADDWSTSAFELALLFDDSDDACLVWMLSAGRPPGDPVIWPPLRWPDQLDLDPPSDAPTDSE